MKKTIINKELGGDYYYNVYFNEKGLFHLYLKARSDYVKNQIKPNSTVLDAGCGSGVLSYLLSKKGCKVTGVDIDKSRIDFCKKEYKNIRFLQKDILKLDLHEKFDYVVCTDVLEHFDNLKIAIENLKKHMNDRLIIGLPTRFYFAIEPIPNFIKKIKKPNERFDNEGTHHYIKDSSFTSNGLEIIKSKTICFGLWKGIELIKKDGYDG